MKIYLLATLNNHIVVDKKHFKTRYENDPEFQKECVDLPHRPLDVLEKGLKQMEEKFKFKDEKANAFKGYFLKYIQVWNILKTIIR